MPILGIGNLSTGGTGKTPMAEYVLQLLLEAGYKPALLSRGYGRKTKGFILASAISNAEQIGDEPYQVFRKFPDATIAVCEDRVEGINRIQKERKDVNVIVLDDCFQHRRLKAGFYILLTEYSKPYYIDYLLPAGRLREMISGRSRANIILMTKCPDVSQIFPRKHLISKLKPYGGQQVYFTGLKYYTPQAANGALHLKADINASSVMSFSGIANPAPFVNYIKSQAMESSHISFSDHHDFSKGDFEKIYAGFESLPEPKFILTTEKDLRRIEGTPGVKKLLDAPLYYLPVGMKWDAMEKRAFDLKILDYVRKNTGNN